MLAFIIIKIICFDNLENLNFDGDRDDERLVDDISWL